MQSGRKRSTHQLSRTRSLLTRLTPNGLFSECRVVDHTQIRLGVEVPSSLLPTWQASSCQSNPLRQHRSRRPNTRIPPFSKPNTAHLPVASPSPGATKPVLSSVTTVPTNYVSPPEPIDPSGTHTRPTCSATVRRNQLSDAATTGSLGAQV